MTSPASGRYAPYAGIGARETPDEILDLIRRVAYRLYLRGYTLRSGGAPGADTAFEGGATPLGDYSRAEVYLPWPNFEGRPDDIVTRTHPQREALDIAAHLDGERWQQRKRGVQQLHGRNIHQMLGRDVIEPVLSKFVVCWTPGGGGTGVALRFAEHFGIKSHNLYDDAMRERVERWLERSASG